MNLSGHAGIAQPPLHHHNIYPAGISIAIIAYLMPTAALPSSGLHFIPIWACRTRSARFQAVGELPVGPSILPSLVNFHHSRSSTALLQLAMKTISLHLRQIHSTYIKHRLQQTFDDLRHTSEQDIWQPSRLALEFMTIERHHAR